MHFGFLDRQHIIGADSQARLRAQECSDSLPSSCLCLCPPVAVSGSLVTAHGLFSIPEAEQASLGSLKNRKKYLAQGTKARVLEGCRAGGLEEG